MATWAEFEAEVPEFARFVTERLTAHKFLTMATIRADGGTPDQRHRDRLSGGELWLAGMTDARRWADLRRDPRVAIHGGRTTSETWRATPRSPAARSRSTTRRRAAFAAGLPRVARRVRAVPDRRHGGDAVRLEDPPVALIIESWRPGEPLKRFDR
jgi:hypothetical protein